MEKMLEDSPKLDEAIALHYAVSVRSCCLYVHGFTPSQLEIGQNIKLPSPFNDDLPALERCTTSPTIAKHLNALANTRKAFTKIETSCKLKKALIHLVHSHCDIKYAKGNSVFYKLPDEPRWQRPASVISVDGKVIISKHGSILQRVHPCRLQDIHHNNCETKDSKSNEHDIWILNGR